MVLDVCRGVRRDPGESAVRTDQDGRYRVVAYPGRELLSVWKCGGLPTLCFEELAPRNPIARASSRTPDSFNARCNLEYGGLTGLTISWLGEPAG